MIRRFLGSVFGPYVVAGAVGVLALSGVYALGRHHGVQAEKFAEARRQEKARLLIAKREATAEKIAAGVSADIGAEKVRVQTVIKTLIEEVPVYVTPAADAQCVVPSGFVRLHDAAASGVPAAAGGPVDAASGVPLSAVASTVAENYGIAYEWRAEALGWRTWYAEQKAAWDRK